MRFALTLFVVVIVAALASAYPFEDSSPSEQQFEELNDGSWKSWEAVKEFFRPMMDWFRNDLPKKTPSDLAGTVQETATDVKEWAANNGFVQTAVNAVKPVQEWVKDTAKTLKDKTFKEMFDDTREQVSKVDETVGGWISNQNAKEK